MVKNTPAVIQPSDLVRARMAEAAESMVADVKTSAEITLDILNAKSIDEILGSTVIGLQSILGEPITIHSANLNQSDFEDGLGAYVVIHATRDNGDHIVVTSGSENVVAQVIAMHAGGHFPQRVEGAKSVKPTAKGYYPLRLQPATTPEQF